MPQAELLTRLDQLIALSEAFSPTFLALHQLRGDIVQATAPVDADAHLDAEFQSWLDEHDYKEACLWTNY